MIALYRGLSPLSWAIRKFTRTDYSHAAWVCGDGSCIEAWSPGGVRHLANPYVGHHLVTRIDYFAVIGLDDERQRHVEAFLLEQVGAKYDIGGVLRFVSRRRANNDSRWFCSELVLAALKHAGMPILNAEPHEISPGHLAWSTEVYRLAEEISRGQWEDYVARRLCMDMGGAK